jgi:hypothetical protein
MYVVLGRAVLPGVIRARLSRESAGLVIRGAYLGRTQIFTVRLDQYTPKMRKIYEALLSLHSRFSIFKYLNNDFAWAVAAFNSVVPETDGQMH